MHGCCNKKERDELNGSHSSHTVIYSSCFPRSAGQDNAVPPPHSWLQQPWWWTVCNGCRRPAAARATVSLLNQIKKWWFRMRELHLNVASRWEEASWEAGGRRGRQQPGRRLASGMHSLL